MISIKYICRIGACLSCALSEWHAQKSPPPPQHPCCRDERLPTLFRGTTLLHVFITIPYKNMPSSALSCLALITVGAPSCPTDAGSDTQLRDEFTIRPILSHSERQLSEMFCMITDSLHRFFIMINWYIYHSTNRSDMEWL